MKTFYQLLMNTLISSITNFTVWFAIIFYVYLQTQAVLATSIISGIFLVATASTGIWFGSLVDHHRKKQVMLASSVISFVMYLAGFWLYQTVDHQAFTLLQSMPLWSFILLLLTGVIAGNLRTIALPTLVTLLVPEDARDKANGMVGTVNGIGFLVTSVISGLLVGHSGMYGVLIVGMVCTLATLTHLWLTPLAEKKIIHLPGSAAKKIDIKGSLAAIRKIPGLLPLIFFTMINNFLGGVFMSLMDAYGLSLVSVQVWGLLFGGLSTAFIFGGIFIAKFGLGKNPLRTMFLANFFIWIISSVFTIYPSIVLLAVGMFLYLAVVPFIEAAEHSIIQKVVPLERQGRVFGFAQSVEQSASPITAFAIGPLAQFFFIPFMTTGAGVQLIGNWFGTGPDRGIALVFTITGIIGFMVTLAARNSRFYHQLSAQYSK